MFVLPPILSPSVKLMMRGRHLRGGNDLRTDGVGRDLRFALKVLPRPSVDYRESDFRYRYRRRKGGVGEEGSEGRRREFG